MKHIYWRVAVALPLPAYDFQPLGDPQAGLGKRVLVPWQGGSRVGVVLAVMEGSLDRAMHIKDTIAVLDAEPIFTPDSCAALLAVAGQSLSFDGLVYQDFMPFGHEPALSHLVQLVAGVNLENLPEQARVLENRQSATLIDPSILEFLRGQGLLLEDVRLELPSREIIQATSKDMPLTDKQAVALEVLRESGGFYTLKAWAEMAGVSPSMVSKLLEKGAAKRELEPLPLTLPDFGKVFEPPIVKTVHLSAAQKLEGITVGRLHGAKPRERFAVLQNLILRAVKNGQSVLYLAPDHVRLERAFKALGGLAKSAMLHGALRPLEREAVWRICAIGTVPILFGTPMALFAPLPDLALIILEDELSDAWKLHGGSRIFVPDAVLTRAEHAKARVLFVGSVPATESLELEGVVLPPPTARVHVVDFNAAPQAPEIGPMSNMPLARDSFPISTDLKRVLRQIAERSRQAVVIAPRRGYSAMLRCKECAWIPYCPHCDVALKFHAAARTLECHQCGYSTVPPTRCPSCEGTVLNPRGPGSEWIVRELRGFLPQTKLFRFDREFKDDLDPIYNGESGIIVGTTAVLGLPPPPNLALIAISFADTMHSSPDFRAGERFHLLLRQLLEWHPTRAPLLLIQTFDGQHKAITQIQNAEAASSFATSELETRQAFLYPPYAQMAQIQVYARQVINAEVASSKLGGLIRDRGAIGLELLGPAPAGIARVKGLFVYQLLVRANSRERLTHLLEPARNYREGGVRVRIDVNPRQLTDLLE
jgi:primosomal protein N' (replication factor Y) (superfamily II helicase)